MNVLEELAAEFFDKTWNLLVSVLPLDEQLVTAHADSNRDNGTVVFELTLPLAYKGDALEDDNLPESFSDLFRAVIRYVMCLDTTGEYLSVSQSKFELRVHTSPGIRFEYERGNTSAPAAHIHYSGTGGLLSPVLMRNFSGTKDHRKKGDIQKLHLPVGGRRFRPSLEEFLYFLIQECGFRARAGWQNVVLESREEWLDTQLSAAVRDNPAVARQELERLGYLVELPEHGEVPKARRLGW
ncbi:hypothetical protein [Corynebacterium cystitidis]|uniref:Uncharacterized protein n=1 Tax=Corynebacterium cystitidis DSM 20524 TaxID=1121357 RepID=A0A1H9UUY7_9CORY|nr:hypothetical protein [Corynebacterium cystitidis]WJY83691.1 hypothetical protein CCYS_14050 [Corynebacterium cystitidis DSM 20524]SES13350.1 hypothetical protein SAMN05661109_01945 [Corynebacterium cystitidis DSM 20524]SNV91286.1 Uncharacterised protein [Corynebacterium cystitidis]